MAQKVHTLIVDEVKTSGYFTLSVDSTPELSHIYQLRKDFKIAAVVIACAAHLVPARDF